MRPAHDDAGVAALELARVLDGGEGTPAGLVFVDERDCVVKEEQTDCCGTILYVGVSVASATKFDACETTWVAQFPGCGCNSNKMTTEDGKTVVQGADGGGPKVHCTDFTMGGGVCMTYLL